MGIALITIVGAVLVLAAITLGVAAFARHGRPYPSCGACGYDVSGSVGDVTRCPECGIAFVEGGIVPARSSRKRVALIGLAALAVGMSCVGTIGVPAMLHQRALAARRQAEVQAALAAQAQAQAQAAANQATAAEMPPEPDATPGSTGP
jgi:hypothetical protein